MKVLRNDIYLPRRLYGKHSSKLNQLAKPRKVEVLPKAETKSMVILRKVKK